MKRISISYDPYKRKTTIKIGNKLLQNNACCNDKLKQFLNPEHQLTLQDWINPNPRDNWNGLLEVFCELGDSKFEIEFKGRKEDFNYLKSSLESQKSSFKDKNIKIDYIFDSKCSRSDKEIGKNIDNVINIMLHDKTFKEMVSESDNRLLIDKYNNLENAYDEIKNEEF